MRLFVQKGYHLGALALPAKLVYTIFLAFIAVGLWTSWAIYAERLGFDAGGDPGVAERYVDPAPDAAGAAAAPDGPALDLPDEPALAEAPAPPGKWPWILDVFHQHLFSVSVVFLILAHLFMLTRLHPAASGTVILLAGLSALLHVLAPVIIHRTGGFLWLMPVTGATMGVTWTAMVAWTLVAMWAGVGLPRPGGADRS